MALTRWKSTENNALDRAIDPWYESPYWRNYRPWTDDTRLGFYPRNSWWRTFRDFEDKFWDVDRKFKYELAPIIPRDTKDGFEIIVDCRNFAPHEITVKTTLSTVTIGGKHEDRQPGRGSISTEFCRRYTLPPGYNGNDVEAELSDDGFLTVNARSIYATSPKPPKRTWYSALPITNWKKENGKWIRDTRFKL
jgi:HSP20 family molecular chaperone IbpA